MTMIQPTIEWNGKIGEIEVESLSRPHQRITKNNIPFYSTSTESRFDLDTFIPVQMAFDIDKSRRVEVTVFVHDAFMRNLTGAPRIQYIEKFTKRNAAWIFSYGKRVAKQLPPWLQSNTGA
jgi:hypothetical protein